jgi:argininosuccinate lyase
MAIDKLWDKNISTHPAVEKFTSAADIIQDMKLAYYDVTGSIAHARMLEKTGIISKKERLEIEKQLKTILKNIRDKTFSISEEAEDVHSQIEFMLTEKLGDTGRKLHSGRSRNDQVLLDLKLYMRDQIKDLVKKVQNLFRSLIRQSNEYRDVLMPGYTHTQIAMPSSFGLWLSSFAEGLIDDLTLILSAYKINDQNPLGTAAGYGSAFPVDRDLTTRLLGFKCMQVNPLFAQNSRLKNEKTIAFAISSLAGTLSKLSNDMCLFNSQNFGFITLPSEYTTGSSIMPHKKNPDVLELIRARCNKIGALPFEIGMVATNLPSGYHRDFQSTKKEIFEAFDIVNQCMDMLDDALNNMQINKHIFDDKLYDSVFSVEAVQKLVMEGVPFRSAYQQVADNIANGDFNPSKAIYHTHEGSISNLSNHLIEQKFEAIMYQFNFSHYEVAMQQLFNEY